MERFVPIKEFEDLYEISNMGNVKCLPRKKGFGKGWYTKPKIRKYYLTNAGYAMVQLIKDKTKHRRTLHRLVAFHFIPNPKNKPQVNHKDKNKLNNKVENLEWATRSENMLHAGVISKKRVKIVQKTLAGVKIKTWPSITAAVVATGLARGSITGCLSGKYKRGGGFIWEYMVQTIQTLK